MFEKVNPSHPDKVADRIAGALVDLAYAKQDNPKIAVEVLIGHGVCHVIAETSVHFENEEVDAIVKRIGGDVEADYSEVPQDVILAGNQKDGVRCGDNGIFKGVPLTEEEKFLADLSKELFSEFPSDGKHIIVTDKDSLEKLVICQSNASKDEVLNFVVGTYDFGTPEPNIIINPLGDWTGGSDVDTGATNRKLGSDMAQSATGGGLHGKDLSKADISVNIFAFALAQMTGKTVELTCAIGDKTVGGIPYESIVAFAKGYIDAIGGFEKFAEWGLVR